MIHTIPFYVKKKKVLSLKKTILSFPWSDTISCDSYLIGYKGNTSENSCSLCVGTWRWAFVVHIYMCIWGLMSMWIHVQCFSLLAFILLIWERVCHWTGNIVFTSLFGLRVSEVCLSSSPSVRVTWDFEPRSPCFGRKRPICPVSFQTPYDTHLTAYVPYVQKQVKLVIFSTFQLIGFFP